MFRYILHAVFALLLVLNAYLFLGEPKQAGELRVSVLDVGQGDAILVEGPTGTQMLIDGGLGQAVLRELAAVMGPTDRTIDLVVESHPDADHIGGLPSVFDRYQVSYFLEPGIHTDSPVYAALEDAVDHEPGVHWLAARRGMRIDLGGGAHADVLFPDRDPSGMDTNDGSIVMRVEYGETSFMLTGDMPSDVEEWLVTLDGKNLESDVLKAGHHGSKTSTGDAWLAAVSPSIVAISAGEGNSYGHPHADVVERIEQEEIEIVSTITEGTITFVSDGVNIKRK